MSLTAFDYQPQTRVVFGEGSLRRLGELAVECGVTRALVVSDPGIGAVGLIERGVAALESAGVATAVYDGVAENPTTRHVDECLATARSFAADGFVGLGGGSSIDTARGANFLLTNGGRMADYWGIGKAKLPMLPLLAVPTTAGTGSEAQSFALIADEHSHRKMACGDKKAACRVAILDPEVTLTLPPKVTAAVGLDAIAHAVESFVTRRRNPVAMLHARSAWQLLAPGFARVLTNGQDREGRGQMLLGAHWAGVAIENSMLGATHSAANPLTAHYGITHGIAIGILLPHVVRFNAQTHSELYADLVDSISSMENGLNQLFPQRAEKPTQAGGLLAEVLWAFSRNSGLPHTLAECGVPKSDLPRLAEEATREWTAQFNPRPVTAADFLAIYQRAFHGDITASI